jgi:hypothetical protein
MYIADIIKPINLENSQRGKTSCSAERNNGLLDIFKKTKLVKTKLPMMNGYNNNNPYKIMDVVKYLFKNLNFS